MGVIFADQVDEMMQDVVDCSWCQAAGVAGSCVMRCGEAKVEVVTLTRKQTLKR